jgi:uncharacterized protein (DUF58 family)
MPTRNGWWFVALGLACLAAGVALSYRELVMVGLAWLGCVVAAAVSMVMRPTVEVKREVSPYRVSEGDRASGVVTVTNVGRRRSAPVQATETLGRSTIKVSLPSLAPGATHTDSYRLPIERRGCYKVGPLHKGRSDPLRLISVSQAGSAPASLWVLPRVHKASPIPTGRSQELEGPTTNSAPRGGIAFHSLRDYVAGDDPRLIHWKSTARTGTLMVRHTVITNEPRLLIVLDTSSEPYADESFEDAVRVAASLVAAGAEKRYPTDFRTTGGVEGSVDPTGTGLSDIMDKLAAVQLTDADPGLRALTTIAPSRNRGVSLGAVTGQPAIDQARTVGLVRGRFDMATIIQVGERLHRPPLSVSGVVSINANTSAEWARIWKLRIG